MQRVLVCAALTLLVSFSGAQAAGNMACDQATLSKLEAEVGAMSGKEGKQAMKRLDKAKQAFKDGDTKKCMRLIGRVKGGKGTAPNSEQGDEQDSG